MPLKSIYSPLANKVPLELSIDLGQGFTYPKPRKDYTRLHWIAHGINATFIVILLSILKHHDHSSWAYCWKLHNYYSPINKGVASIPYIETRFDGSLWYPSPFKGPPNPQTEEAWHSVMQYGMIGVSGSELQAVGHNISTAARFPDAAGGDYIAVAVGTHQLHCLHYIWQDHHRSYFKEVQDKIRDIPEMYERHYEHCVDYIRQSLMCSFDTALVTYDWVLDHQNPTPNSNAMHKCVDWDGVQNWLKSRAVEMPDDFLWSQPDGQESLPWNP